LVPERVRRIAGQSFAFVPHRFLREGFFSSVSPDELRLYFLLVLAADRFGVSYNHYDTLCTLLQLPLDGYLKARDGLIDKDLVAFDGTRFQVLSLPARPVRSTPAPRQPSVRRREDIPPATGTTRRRASARPPSAPVARGEEQAQIRHRKVHPNPEAHPDCEHCQSSQRARESLRETIAALEARARIRGLPPTKK
jgi:hypothetical protein